MLHVVPVGTVLVRVHRIDRRPDAFNDTARPPPPPGAPIQGGRFDSQDGSCAYLYAAFTEAGAFAESFARQLDHTTVGPRPLPRARIAGTAVSQLATARDLRLVIAHGAGAQQLGQDDWLTRCDEEGYPLCRRWAAQIRTWEPTSDGLIWRSKRDPDGLVMVLWTSTNAPPMVAPTNPPITEPLDNGAAHLRLQAFLVRWRLYLER